PALPDCVWGAEMNASFYSYTADGFVTLIDFANSGFQPLSFNLAFNRTGPGTSGDLLRDRMSVENVNVTGNSAEHLIFIEEPDPVLFPDGICGEAIIEDQLRCTDIQGGFCIPVRTTAPGQVEIILDFNGNETFDPDTDILLAHTFEENASLSTCLEWDGLLPDGSMPADSVTVNIVASYTQGVQHWALYDGELLSSGFCVTPVRPVCSGNSLLYYDDQNISDDPGTGASRDGRQGCDCEAPNCRNWTNFNPNTEDCGSINDGVTTGYGDKNTLNTWWFASIATETYLNVPLTFAELSGPFEHCPGDTVTVVLAWLSNQEMISVNWTGPNGAITTSPTATQIAVDQAGRYTASVTDAAGCVFTADYILNEVDCGLTVQTMGKECYDNGTPTDPSDDTFTAIIGINGSNSSGWHSPELGISGGYDTIIHLGPFPISEGMRTLSFIDDRYACCIELVQLLPPATCSAECAITSAVIQSNICDDNGTPLDPLDDTFTFQVEVSGSNLSGHWNATTGESGAYDELYSFGPFPIADGPQVIGFEDSENAACFINVTVTPPNTCSDKCLFVPEVSNVRCDDNGTPYDPADDIFYFDLQVNSVNATNLVYQVNGQGVHFYGDVETFGPFFIREGNRIFTIYDIVNQECSQEIQITPPPPCSDLCGIQILDVQTGCDDNRTPEDTSDDFYYYEILVHSFVASNTTWVANDGTTGEYGVYVKSVPHQFQFDPFALEVTDAVNNHCTDADILHFPWPEMDCPEDTDRMIYENTNVLQINSSLTSADAFLRGEDDLSCWLDESFTEDGTHYYDRITFNRAADAGPTELFSFYLFSNLPDSASVGAIFNISEYEAVDCCNMLNPGPLTPWVLKGYAGPILPDSLYPVGMDLTQQFSALINPGQDFTLATTSWSAEEMGNYTWMVVSSAEDQLIMHDPSIETLFFPDVPMSFELRTFQRERIMNDPNSEPFLGRTVETVNGCGPLQVAFTDEMVGDCDSITMSRTYHLTLGDTTIENSCGRLIGFKHLGIDEIIMPAQNLRFTCSDTFPELDNGHPDPAFTGYPAIYDMGETVFLNEAGFADLIAGFYDIDSTDAMGNRVIYRYWQIQDFCLTETTDYLQRFKMAASGDPFMSCPLSNHYCPVVDEDLMLFFSDLNTCSAQVPIPMPDLINVCNRSTWTIMARVYQTDTLADGTVSRTEFINLELDGSEDPLTLGLGDYFIDYEAYESDTLRMSTTCRFRIVDAEQPTAICRSLLNLSLPGSGQIRLFTHSLDLGSYDNCDGFTLDVRREFLYDAETCEPLTNGEIIWGEWGSSVDFTCCDVGFTYRVELRITDASGNVNFCTAEVTVRDNTLPYCTGLIDQTLSCDQLPDDFNAFDLSSLQTTFGFPEVVDNCSAEATELPPVVTGTSCSPETIIRRFVAVDQHGNESAGIFEQVITIIPSLRYQIKFPRDTETNCVDEVNVLDITGTGCDSITAKPTFLNKYIPQEWQDFKLGDKNAPTVRIDPADPNFDPSEDSELEDSAKKVYRKNAPWFTLALFLLFAAALSVGFFTKFKVLSLFLVASCFGLFFLMNDFSDSGGKPVIPQTMEDFFEDLCADFEKSYEQTGESVESYKASLLVRQQIDQGVAKLPNGYCETYSMYFYDLCH
ncbi:MAG: hypothetical protein AAF828_11570, partial [Bacteroidota bacterium]